MNKITATMFLALCAYSPFGNEPNATSISPSQVEMSQSASSFGTEPLDDPQRSVDSISDSNPQKSKVIEALKKIKTFNGVDCLKKLQENSYSYNRIIGVLIDLIGLIDISDIDFVIKSCLDPYRIENKESIRPLVGCASKIICGYCAPQEYSKILEKLQPHNAQLMLDRTACYCVNPTTCCHPCEGIIKHYICGCVPFECISKENYCAVPEDHVYLVIDLPFTVTTKYENIANAVAIFIGNLGNISEICQKLAESDKSTLVNKS